MISTCNRVEVLVHAEGDAAARDFFTSRAAEARPATSTPSTAHGGGAPPVPRGLQPRLDGGGRAADPRAGEGGVRGGLRRRDRRALTSRGSATGPSPPPSASAPRPRSAAASPASPRWRWSWCEKIFGDLAGRAILLVGAGKMGALSARALAALGADRILVANRSAERGLELAAQVGGVFRGWEELPRLLVEADVVIVSTGAERHVLTREHGPGGHAGPPPPLDVPHRPGGPAQRRARPAPRCPTSTPTTWTTWRRSSSTHARGPARRGRAGGVDGRGGRARPSPGTGRRGPRCRCWASSAATPRRSPGPRPSGRWPIWAGWTRGGAGAWRSWPRPSSTSCCTLPPPGSRQAAAAGDGELPAAAAQLFGMEADEPAAPASRGGPRRPSPRREAEAARPRAAARDSALGSPMIRIATRRSPLARWQASHVADLLRARDPGAGGPPARGGHPRRQDPGGPAGPGGRQGAVREGDRGRPAGRPRPSWRSTP